ncbi:MAG: 16S rRNA (uracil(1498)-N(3))-methyltransferase [Planctomyces sp.]|nr:16S rRNA (uracil(1498)-N(3))-methyltransferase [Planctomyces sp.]
MDRFFCPDFATGPDALLDEAEAHHLQHVLRYRVGDQVEVFDGRGACAAAEIRELSRRGARLRLTSEAVIDPEPPVRLVLGVAPPKGDRFRWLVEKATELSVGALVPLLCERSVVEPRDSRLQKLEQTVVSACKQCGRNRLMELRSPQSLRDFFSSAGSCRRLAADPGGPRLDVPLAEAGETALVAIGPEGGFSPQEVGLLDELGVARVSLGETILRIETAAIAVAAVARLVGGPPRHAV